ncbi:peptidoglycan DD-metalloendopeptidase family protein [Pseudoxanthomonas sp.]|uniref:peptidoglycan DD-metalloendopeptidase family protein n=1 Tax=Pseudoxanthomonas sp. TaxID=1871049 RepID=UPI0026397BD6|nr:peptidoglycan DD-metalloendopeptidase family protein [Pseudoxanthomonas sp.]WDS37663.1 MAG: peptidoglycan DD-metalloendopeptidase family protein [Pseudoxanthomonas sp.]
MSPRAACASALCLLLLATGLTTAQAGRLYKWKDAQGVTHYAGKPPGQQAPAAGPVDVLHFQSTPSALVKLRLEKTPTRYQAWADNLLPGPVQVQLSFVRQRGLIASPDLPVRKLVPAHGSVLVSTLIVADPLAGSDFQLKLDAQPGDPQARPLDVMYQLPFDAPIRVDQGPGGHLSHDDAQNFDAIDFALPEGTPVLAARDGVVMQVEGDFDKAGLDKEKFGGRSNFVRILHGDGTMALYAHLKPEGVLVRAGQSVTTGQRIGLSGNTGFSTAPHLHFVVQVNTGMRLASVPIQMRGPLGELRFPDQAPGRQNTPR